MLINEVSLNIYLLAFSSYFISFRWFRFQGKNDFEIPGKNRRAGKRNPE